MVDNNKTSSVVDNKHLKTMKTSKKGLDLIIYYETGGNLKKYLKAYDDSTGLATIGIGSTYYEDGTKVKYGDVITEQRAKELFANILPRYEAELTRLLKKPVNQDQFDALVSFIYNLGGSNLSKSTLLKKINANPNDPSIAAEFLKWNKAGGKVLRGLAYRREDEAQLYFSKPYINWKEGNDESTVGTETSADLNLRSGAGTGYKVLKVLPKGTTVQVLKQEGDWSYVSVNPTYGWVSTKYLK